MFLVYVLPQSEVDVLTLLSRYAHGVVYHRLIIIIVAASAIGVAITSRDVFMPPIAAATLAGIAVVGLRRIWRSGPWAGWKHVRTAQTLSIVAVPFAFTTGLSVDSKHLFREAFAAPLPAGVRDLVVDANMLNPAGKRTALLRFRTNAETMAELLKAADFQQDPQMQEAWSAGERWENLIRQAFGQSISVGGSAWQSIGPLPSPEFRHWMRDDGGLRMDTRILWDGQTGEAFVLYTVR
jgi:hypothetical protein